ncbi:hypothetical protein, partial [Pseudomonas vlassakiae]|uniref:hypothetical protein n=1 Tax=Pseudomonas vlassakiae TaxID=485888 RepID=UPI003AACBFD9
WCGALWDEVVKCIARCVGLGIFGQHSGFGAAWAGGLTNHQQLPGLIIFCIRDEYAYSKSF